MVTSQQRKTYKNLLKEQKLILKKATKRSKITTILSLVFGVGLGILLVVIEKSLENKGIISSKDFSKYDFLSLVLFYVFFILQIIVHEAGHLVFGLLSGYRFLSFRIFSLTFVKKDSRLIKKKYSIKGTAGQCLMYPPKKRADGSYPYVLYNLGGGLANLIFSLPFLIPAIYTDNPILRAVFLALLISGILVAATNIIPLELGVQNDGMNLLNLSKGRHIQDSFYLHLLVNAEMTDGKLLTDYPMEYFNLAEGVDDTNSFTASNRLFSYYRLLADNDYDSAYKLLMEMVEKSEKYPLTILNTLQAEQLFFMVLHHKPIEEIASMYYRVRSIFKYAKTQMGIWRIRYIYESLLSEDEKKAIMSLIKNKKIKKWKPTNLNKLYQEMVITANNHPVIGDVALHMAIIDYCIENFGSVE